MRIETVDYHTAGEPFRIVTGGVEPLAGDFAATAIDSATGKPSASGDITPLSSLESAAKTLGTVLGLEQPRLEQRISTGKTVRAAVAT